MFIIHLPVFLILSDSHLWLEDNLVYFKTTEHTPKISTSASNVFVHPQRYFSKVFLL